MHSLIVLTAVLSTLDAEPAPASQQVSPRARGLHPIRLALISSEAPPEDQPWNFRPAGALVPEDDAPVPAGRVIVEFLGVPCLPPYRSANGPLVRPYRCLHSP